MKFIILFNIVVFALYICFLLNSAVNHITTHAANPGQAPSFFKENRVEFALVFMGIVTTLISLHSIT